MTEYVGACSSRRAWVYRVPSFEQYGFSLSTGTEKRKSKHIPLPASRPSTTKDICCRKEIERETLAKVLQRRIRGWRIFEMLFVFADITSYLFSRSPWPYISYICWSHSSKMYTRHFSVIQWCASVLFLLFVVQPNQRLIRCQTSASAILLLFKKSAHLSLTPFQNLVFPLWTIFHLPTELLVHILTAFRSQFMAESRKP